MRKEHTTVLESQPDTEEGVALGQIGIEKEGEVMTEKAISAMSLAELRDELVEAGISPARVDEFIRSPLRRPAAMHELLQEAARLNQEDREMNERTIAVAKKLLENAQRTAELDSIVELLKELSAPKDLIELVETGSFGHEAKTKWGGWSLAVVSNYGPDSLESVAVTNAKEAWELLAEQIAKEHDEG